jgi:hypothetical protein
MAYIESKDQDKDDHGSKGGGNDKPKEVTVQFNGNPLVLNEKVMTGLEIKQAAIAQQQPVQVDFVLQLQRPNGEYDPISDSETVHIRKGLEFTCIAPDDNS